MNIPDAVSVGNDFRFLSYFQWKSYDPESAQSNQNWISEVTYESSPNKVGFLKLSW